MHTEMPADLVASLRGGTSEVADTYETLEFGIIEQIASVRSDIRHEINRAMDRQAAKDDADAVTRRLCTGVEYFDVPVRPRWLWQRQKWVRLPAVDFTDVTTWKLSVNNLYLLKGGGIAQYVVLRDDAGSVLRNGDGVPYEGLSLDRGAAEFDQLTPKEYEKILVRLVAL